MIPSKLISRRGIAVVPSTVLEPDPGRSARLLDLRRCHRIGAVIGGVKGARPVVARKADAAEWGVRGRAVGGRFQLITPAPPLPTQRPYSFGPPPPNAPHTPK